jgi:hypothetical protein
VIEDPLVPSNNLGRTCFRVFQVQCIIHSSVRTIAHHTL